MRAFRLIAASSLLLCGCSATHVDVTSTLHPVGGVTALDFSADRRALLIKQPNAGERICSEPKPDAGESASGGLSLSAAGDSLGDKSSETQQSFGGIDSTVRLAREILFRACELSMNTNASYEQSLALYQAALDAIKALSATEAGKGTGTSGGG